MTEKDWHNGYVRCLGVRLAGDLIGGTDERGIMVVGYTVLLLMNVYYEAILFLLPPLKKGQRWEPVLDTAPEPLPFEGEPLYELQGRSMAVLHTTPQHNQTWRALGIAPLLSTGEPHAEDRDKEGQATL
jgi:glycogen operon protein